jgi:hypothetical protein
MENPGDIDLSAVEDASPLRPHAGFAHCTRSCTGDSSQAVCMREGAGAYQALRMHISSGRGKSETLYWEREHSSQ